MLIRDTVMVNHPAWHPGKKDGLPRPLTLTQVQRSAQAFYCNLVHQLPTPNLQEKVAAGKKAITQRQENDMTSFQKQKSAKSAIILTTSRL